MSRSLNSYTTADGRIDEVHDIALLVSFSLLQMMLDRLLGIFRLPMVDC